MQNLGSLAIIQQALQRTNRTISIQNWLTDESARATLVEIVRRYVNGAPDNFLTTAQRTMINLSANAAPIHQFSDNYCPAILDTTLDRIQLTGIEASFAALPTPAPIATPMQSGSTNSVALVATQSQADQRKETAQVWIDHILDSNRLDELQVNVHEAALRDGNAFLMVDAIRQTDHSTLIRLTQEPAYDGFYGMVVMYETAMSKQPSLAAKVWRITSPNVGDTVRLNMYYPNRIERYIGFIGGGLRPYGIDSGFDLLPNPINPNDPNEKPLSVDPSAPVGTPPGPDDTDPSVIPWTMDGTLEGEPIGVPVIHYRNKGNNVTTHGISELQDVIPLQDLLNRTLYDMAATSALSAFGVRFIIGQEAPDTIQPGDIKAYFVRDTDGNVAVPDEAGQRWLNSIRIDEFKQADMVPYISQAQWLKNEMFAVTNTPEMEGASAAASGESLRQREVKLIGKVNRFEVRNGNAWEDTMLMCAGVQTAFSEAKPPELESLNAKWKNPEIRNDTNAQSNALLLYTNGVIDQETMLDMIAPIYDWDQSDIDHILAETMKARGMNQLGAQDAQNVMDKLNRANGGGTASANGSGGGTNGAQPVKAPPLTQVGAGKVTDNGQQDTSGA